VNLGDPRKTVVTDPPRESEERFRTTFAHASVGMAMATPEGRYLEVNRAFCEVTGYTEAELLATDLQSITHPEDRPESRRGLRQLLAGEIPGLVIEKRYVRKDGGVVWAQDNIALARDPAGKPENFVMVVQDITVRKRAEQALRENEEERRRGAEALQRAHEFAESIIETANVIFLQLDAAGIVRKVNAAAEEITGYKRAEMEGRSWAEALVPRDRYPYVWEEFDRLMKEGATGGSFENPILTRKGEERQILWRNTTLREGNQIIGLISFGMDVTDLSTARKRLEALSQRLVHLQDEERRAIARELHGEVGQLLTGLGLMIEAGDGPGAASRRHEMKRVVDELIGRVRDLSMMLRPPMLDELGLLPTLLWQIGRFELQTAIHVDFRHANLDGRFPSEIEITIFHTVQEALTNVARHAGVEMAKVEVWAGSRSLGARIEDQGRGFVVETALDGHSSGLAGMRERCRLLGGQLTIDSTPGTGTRLSIELPLEARPARDAET
jgi:PAS domain S-box-containing protein